MNPLQTSCNEVDGWRIFARLLPDLAPPGRLPVVCVHGLSMSSEYMLPLARRLAPDFPVYVPDLPGYGKSQKLSPPLSLDQLAAALHGWMMQCGLGRAVLVGNSMGCQVIVRFALNYPQEAAKIVLVSPTIDRYARSYRRQIWRGVRDLLYEPLAFYGVMLRDYWRAGPRMTLRVLGMAIDDPLERWLPQVNVPALVVRGEHDPIVSQRWAEEVAALLPQGRFILQQGAAHVANYDDAAELAEFVRAFVEDKV